VLFFISKFYSIRLLSSPDWSKYPFLQKKILRKAGKWIAKMPEPFAPDFDKLSLTLHTKIDYYFVGCWNGLTA
jgi:hypothetical protein